MLLFSEEGQNWKSMVAEGLTFSIRRMFNHITILNRLDNTSNESLRSFRCIVDRDQRVRAFGVRHVVAVMIQKGAGGVGRTELILRNLSLF